MYAKKKQSTEKRTRLKLIIEWLSDKQVDALLTLLEDTTDPDFEMSPADELLVAERIARYESGKAKTMSADESIRRIRKKLAQTKRK